MSNDNPNEFKEEKCCGKQEYAHYYAKMTERPKFNPLTVGAYIKLWELAVLLGATYAASVYSEELNRQLPTIGAVFAIALLIKVIRR
jgi:hypothetical protein